MVSEMSLTLCNLHADVLFHIFMSVSNIYDMIQLSIINKYMYIFYNVYKSVIFYNKTKYCNEFMESSYKYFFNFTHSIHKKCNNLLNNNSIKIKSALQIFKGYYNDYKIHSYNEYVIFKDVQDEFIKNVEYTENYAILYKLLFCPCLILFKNIPLIESWYVVVKNRSKIYKKLNDHFFDIIKMKLYELKLRDYNLFVKVLHSQIINSHTNNEFYMILFDVLYELDPDLFVNELQLFLSNYKVNKDNLKDMDIITYRYENYIDYTNNEIYDLYRKYKLNELQLQFDNQTCTKHENSYNDDNYTSWNNSRSLISSKNYTLYNCLFPLQIF